MAGRCLIFLSPGHLQKESFGGRLGFSGTILTSDSMAAIFSKMVLMALNV